MHGFKRNITDPHRTVQKCLKKGQKQVLRVEGGVRLSVNEAGFNPWIHGLCWHCVDDFLRILVGVPPIQHQNGYF